MMMYIYFFTYDNCIDDTSTNEINIQKISYTIHHDKHSQYNDDKHHHHPHHQHPLPRPPPPHHHHNAIITIIIITFRSR